MLDYFSTCKVIIFLLIYVEMKGSEMTWFATHRQEWIKEMLTVYGFINRQHLQRQFGISSAQAALDFRAFQDTNTDVMHYDASEKTYRANTPPERL